MFGGGGDVIARPRKSRRRDHASTTRDRARTERATRDCDILETGATYEVEENASESMAMCDAKRGCSEICAGRRCKASLGVHCDGAIQRTKCARSLQFVLHTRVALLTRPLPNAASQKRRPGNSHPSGPPSHTFAGHTRPVTHVRSCLRCSLLTRAARGSGVIASSPLAQLFSRFTRGCPRFTRGCTLEEAWKRRRDRVTPRPI